MGNTVKRFVVEVGKAAAKGATSFVLGKVPFIGTPLANKINSLYQAGGEVASIAGGAPVPAGMSKMVINTPQQLLNLVKKEPEIAAKVGLTVEKVQEGIQKAKEGQAVAAKKRGGKMGKKMSGDKVMVHSGGGGEGVGSFARGGKVLSVF